jgi:asparagine synthase (glutamine-hydrolysing)
MCGIGGIVGPGSDPQRVHRMMDEQKHRGPDGEGFFSDREVALGHRRLSIIDLSDAGRQPMSTPDGRYTLIFNGEIYNYRELRSELSPAELRSSTDSEILLHAYAKWGPNCLERLIGMFAFAIWDSNHQELFLARDRFGIKPLYFSRLDGDFLFSSEIRGLLTAGVERTVNEKVLYDFLARDFYEHNDETFFAGIHKLPPASWMVIKRSGEMVGPEVYWSLADEAAKMKVPARQEEREEVLLNLCSSAIDLHLRSDVPVAVALSGGLDSATLLALLDRVHPDPSRVEAFSFCFPESEYSERPYVEAMATHTGRKATFAEVSAKTFAETAEKFCLSQEEPYAGAPISAYSLCFERARAAGFIVVMDGSGLDEGLAGYDRFRPARWADLLASGRHHELELEFASGGVNSELKRNQAAIQMKIAAQPAGDVGLGQDLTKSVKPDCINQDFANFAASESPTFSRPFHDSLRNLMYRELRYTKLPRALRFRDRLSMAVGTELRPPFLDHRLMAYEFALPAEDLIHRGVSKSILRRAAKRLLPETTRLASKRSVQTPQREWFRNELKDWVRERVDQRSFWQRGWIDRKTGMHALEQFLNGKGDNSFFIWQWINLEIWARNFIDVAASAPKARELAS